MMLCRSGPCPRGVQVSVHIIANNNVAGTARSYTAVTRSVGTIV